jgi:hypothetical protein
MRKRVALAAMLAGVAVGGAAGTALAATSGHGTLVRYVHHKTAKDGTLVLKNDHGKQSYIVPDKGTICGYQRGQTGGPLPGGCQSLGKKKYRGDKVRIRYTKKNGQDVASYVVVVE